MNKPKKTRRTPAASTLAVRNRMLATRRRDTPLEVEIRSLLHRAGYRFRVDYKLPGVRSRGDIVFPRQRVAVFIDGCFWHGCPEHGTWPKANAAWWRAKLEGNIERDKRVNEALTDEGWKVIRIWEHETGALASSRIAAYL